MFILKYGHENAEMQKRKSDDVTLQYFIFKQESSTNVQTYFTEIHMFCL